MSYCLDYSVMILVCYQSKPNDVVFVVSCLGGKFLFAYIAFHYVLPFFSFCSIDASLLCRIPIWVIPWRTCIRNEFHSRSICKMIHRTTCNDTDEHSYISWAKVRSPIVIMKVWPQFPNKRSMCITRDVSYLAKLVEHACLWNDSNLPW